MKINIGIVGYGNLGKAIEQVIISRNDCNLVAIFSRRLVKSKFNTPTESYENISSYKDKIDIMLLCGGSFCDIEKQTTDVLLNFDCINSFDNHKKILQELKRLNKLGISSKHRLIMACGWDPGVFSNIRAMCYAISNEKPIVFWGKGISMGHSEALRKIPNVVDAVEFTIPNESAVKLARKGKLNGTECLHLRDCYVVADKKKCQQKIESNIREIPDYFKGQPTVVNFVPQEKILKLKQKLSHKGEIISKFKTIHGSSCSMVFRLKLKSNADFTATVMASYINAIMNLRTQGRAGAFTPLDIPTIDLFKKESREKIIESLC